MRPSVLFPFLLALIWHGSMDSLAAGERESQSRANSVLRAVAAVEQELAASVGLYVRDVDSGELITHSADDRFPLNSTFKLFACAALLQRVESGISELEATVELDERQLIAWSPRIEQLLEAGRTHATIDELCAAMLSVSDNTAANLILGEIGGPPEFTRYMRTLGDRTTRLDRWEPELTEGLPGDARDTTSPRAIGTSLEALLLGTHLKPSSRAKLQDWLADHRVADDLFRSVLPENWSIHDRTGAGNHGTRGIVAVIYRPTSGPIVAAMYMRDANVSIAERNAAIARVGRAIFVHFGADYSASSPAFGQP